MLALDVACSPLVQIAEDISSYYAGTLSRHGPTPRGVDWSCQPTQELRFIQLLRVCSFNKGFSLNDVGCGYGALRDFLRRRHRLAHIDYCGVDLSNDMVDSAILRWGNLPHTRFKKAGARLRVADYCIASGLFNVKLNHADNDWELWVEHTLNGMQKASRRGFAVNFLAPLQTGETGPQELYRPPPARWTDHCKNSFGGQVELLADYGMQEYTLLVRKS